MDENRYDGRMSYERCGKSGVLLPRISLGMWHNFGTLTPYERSREIALYAFDQGITHFDLANNYGPEPGEAEQRIGKLLREDLAGHRDELFISTKAAYDMWDGPYGAWASRKHLVASLDQSLKRLGLDYVDLFYCHRYDPLTPLDETLQCLVDIVRSGRALYVGISRWPLPALKTAIAYLDASRVPMLIYQGRYNMLDTKVHDDGILDYLSQRRKGFIAFSPLAQGLLSGRYLHGIPEDSRMAEGRFLKSDVLTPQLRAHLEAWNHLAFERGQTLSQMALAWVLQHSAVTSVLVGVSSKEQLAQNIRSLTSAPFTEEELQCLTYSHK
ncbi:MAG: aldo/keto reductase [Bacteroidaceae bacterium]|nr:aldo/keto reductase [Bacteroidaceae bacterium]